MPHATNPRILFIDAYDSFTNNIIALLETHLRVSVTTIKIDTPIPDFLEFLEPFSAVIAGPGPGDPRKSKDVGWIQELWKLAAHDVLPVLGICLGFQSLVLAFGGTIDRLGEPRHGVVRRVRGAGESIFREVEEVETVQYHSLYASVGSESERGEHCHTKNASLKCLDLRPLAWDYDTDNVAEEAVSLSMRRILMAVEHTSKPFFGIQFHAESICSNRNARKVIEAWWEVSKKWRRPDRDSGYLPSPPQTPYAGFETFQDDRPILDHRRAVDKETISSISTNGDCNRATKESTVQQDAKKCKTVYCSQPRGESYAVQVTTSVVDVEDATVPSICETLGLTERETIILDSELHQRRDVGGYSIIGLVSPSSLRLEYQIGTNEVRRIHKGQNETISLRYYDGSIFSYLESFMSQYKVLNVGLKVPFWGGLMGFISYEACLETIGVFRSHRPSVTYPHRPDLSFVFVERSIVIDHSQQKIYVQTIRPGDQDWVHSTISQVKGIGGTFLSSSKPSTLSSNVRLSLPKAASYKPKIRACQSAIRAGDSYELCLTNQATIHTKKRPAAWPLYLRLRCLNPAPFSAYVRLGKLTLLSSSPERFLQWSRPTKPSKSCTNGAFDCEEMTIRCQFRPIKGTVQRQPNPNIPALTLAEATSLLATPKERAENLMIVDLIRHDLHGVVGSGRVTVPKLMVVEEYATLFQLVSVVEGSLVLDDDHDEVISNVDKVDDSHNTSILPTPKSGLDILAASLPPGSMTGAPKLRSCQLLHDLESHPRGIYSGVLGYLDIGGGGDFSVVIRSAVHWDHADRDIEEAGDAAESGEPTSTQDDTDEWTIGAGGAVTSMSTEEGEWEEMCAKMRSTLRLFEGPESEI